MIKPLSNHNLNRAFQCQRTKQPLLNKNNLDNKTKFLHNTNMLLNRNSSPEALKCYRPIIRKKNFRSNTVTRIKIKELNQISTLVIKK